MRWLFLSPSLDYQRDGVADYCRRLVDALQKKGAQGQVYGFKNQPKLSVFVRLLNDYSPDVISWQFVPYAYHQKGIPWQMRAWSKAMRNFPARRHLMMHELWLGINRHCSAKERAVGLMQRLAIQATVRKYQPHCIHTSNTVYQTALKRCGFYATISPIFGNVSKPEPGDIGATKGLALDPAIFFRIVHFGRVHPQLPIFDVIAQMKSGTASLDKSLAIIFAGHTHRSEGWLDSAKQLHPDVILHESGSLSSGELSTLFQQVDAGLSSMPLALVGKSGSMAAMREHGLPVFIARDDFTSRYAETPAVPLNSGCFPLWQMATEDWSQIQRNEMCSSVDTVADQLLAAFDQ